VFSVVLDTCVLYPTYLRDTLLRLASGGLYRPLWSGDILDELVRNLPATVTPAAADSLLVAMRTGFPDATVTGHEELIGSMRNDPTDRHVLAAAVRADAAAVVTFNLSDFPDDALDPLHIAAIHPDEFLLDLLDLSPAATIDALRQQVASYRRPTMTLHDLAGTLRRSDCPQFADQLVLHIAAPHV
jgi:predicted nucleic acid-binding protein